MAITLTIGGTTRKLQEGSLHIEAPANGRATAAFEALSLDGTFSPSLDQEVIIEEGGTRIFGGLILQTRKRAAANAIGTATLVTDVSCVDFNAYTDRRFVSISIASGTLTAALSTLITNYLSTYGVTLHGSQVTGPTLPPLAYTVTPLTDVLNDIMRLTADAGDPFVWRIDYSKVLRAFQPSTQAAPFNVQDPVSTVRSDIVVQSRRGSNYGNRIIVYMPPRPEYNHVDSFTGDGSTTAFTLTRTLFGHRGYVTSAGIFETLGESGSGATWIYSSVNNTITRTSAPANGDAISITYDGTLSANVAAENSSEITAVGLWEKLVFLDSIPAGTTAQDIADAELAKSIYPETTVHYTTRELALFPGQSQGVNLSARGVSSLTGVVTDLKIRDFGRDEVLRDVSVTVDNAKTNLGRGYRDVYRRWLGGPTAPSGGSATVGSGSAIPVPGEAVDAYVVKTADETVTNSATLQNDNHLLFPVIANAFYFFELFFLYTGPNTTADMQIGWSVPSGTTMLWGPQAQGAANYFITLGAANNATPFLTESTVLAVGTTGVAGTFGAWFAGWVTVSSTAGNVQFRWAQNTADAGTNTVLRKSFIRYRRIAA